MKKLLTVLIFVIATPVFGQNYCIGLKGGINWTNVSSTDALSNNENRSGVHGGLTLEYHLNKQYYLGMDFIYIQKGFRMDFVFIDEAGNTIGENATSEFNYDYVSFPLKGGFVIGDTFSGFINLGLVPSLLIDATTMTPAIEGFSEETSINVTNKVTRFDFGGLVEIGASYRIIDNVQLSALVGYQYSITSITNENYFSDEEARNYGMTVSIGLKYALNKE